MRSAFSLIFVLMVASALLQISVVTNFELKNYLILKPFSWASLREEATVAAKSINESIVEGKFPSGVTTSIFDSERKESYLSATSRAETDDSDSESSFESDSSRVHVKATKMKLS